MNNLSVKSQPVRYPIKATAMFFAVNILWSLSALAQSPDKPPSFEVISIKPSPPDGAFSMFPSPGGKFSARNITPWLLIQTAFKIQRSQLESAPGWIETEKYNILAQADHSVTNDELRLMLQSLLADRFRLTLRKEAKEMTVLALTAPKGGAKLHPPTGTKTGILTTASANSIRWTAENATMAQLAEKLTGFLGRPAVDRTDVKDRFSFGLEFARNSDAETTTDSLPSIFTAIQERLGLKLESQKGVGEFFVVDHIEKPTAN